MKRVIGAFIIILLASIGGHYAFITATNLSWFSFTNVKIDCPESIDHESIIDASNLKIGESIFRQDIKTAGNILLGMSGIEAVQINRQLPNSIEINLESDKVELFARTNRLCGLTRTLKLIDIKGYNEILPVITGLKGTRKPNYQDKLKLCYALAMYNELKQLSKTLADRLSEIHFRESGKIDLIFNPGGVKVLLHRRNYRKALYRLSILDFKGILGNTGFFDMTAGKMVVKNGI